MKNKIKSRLLTPSGFVVLATIAVLAVSLRPSKPKWTMPRATVKITNLESNSGGSGTVISSTPMKSTILTNAHVCHVVENGGLVHTDTGSHFVTGYQKSSSHDLCLISIASDLGIDTPISNVVPKTYSTSTVSGHPLLLPTIIDRGMFSGRTIIPVLIGFRPCTLEDATSPDLALFCVLAGGVPLVKIYDAQVISNLIQPGSSGSAVYNDDNEISAVVFAGSSDIGHGFVVPLEYVRRFLFEEVGTAVVVTPNAVITSGKSQEKLLSPDFKKLETACDKLKTLGRTSDFCAVLK